MYELTPVTLKEAKWFVKDHHRHHPVPQGGLFAIGLSENDKIIGVAIVGRPVARMLDTGYVAEVTRLCVLEGHKNACSKLYAACWRAARAMGYKRLITYILASEDGVSLIAAGFHVKEDENGEPLLVGGGTWNRPNCGRPRIDTAPTSQKKLFEVGITQ